MEEPQRHQSHNSEVPTLESDDPPSTCCESTLDSHGLHSAESNPSFNQNDIVKALEVAERDSAAIAESFSSLFASLRVALSEVSQPFLELNVQYFSIFFYRYY